MRCRVFLILVLIAAVTACAGYLSAKCCPPPPNISKPPIKTLPPIRTKPPVSLLTGPPSTDSNTPIYEPEFAWEDWLDEMLRHSLQVYDKDSRPDYANLYKAPSVPSLLAMFAYGGQFDKGLHRMAAEALREMGDDAVNQLVKIASGNAQLPEGSTPRYLNRQQLEELAIYALGLLGGEQARQELGQIAQLQESFRDETMLGGDVRGSLNACAGDRLRNKRFRACIALGMIGDPEDVALLKTMLNNEKDKYVRSAAATGLALIDSQRSLDALRSSIEQPRSYFHAKAFTLAATGSLGAADPLGAVREALGSTCPESRVAASFGLAHLINRRTAADRDCHELVNLYLAALWREEDTQTRRLMALSMLALETENGTDLLEKFLFEWRDPMISGIAALAFGLAASQKVGELIPDIPTDNEPAVEKARAYAMAMVMAPDKSKLALDLACEEDPVLRAAGIFALARTLGKDASREIEKHRVPKFEPIIGCAYAWCAVLRSGDRGIDVGKNLVKNDDPLVRAMALVALGSRGGPLALQTLSAFRPDAKTADLPCRDLSMALLEAIPLIGSITTGLDDGKGTVRGAACVGLAMLDQPGTVGSIINATRKDVDIKARAYANHALSLMSLEGEDRAAAVEGLLWVLANEKHYHPKCWAAIALSRFPDSPDAMKVLLRTAGDQHTDVKASAAIALGLTGERRFAGELKTIAARNKGTPVQYAAQLGVGLLGDRSNVSWYLLDFEFAENQLQYSALSYGMAQSMEDDQAALLFRLVRSEDVFSREAAIKTLGMIKDLKPETRQEIAQMLSTYEASIKAEKRGFDEDALTSFYAAVVRSALGDRNALNAVAEAMMNRGFYLEKCSEPGWDAVMDPINDRLPVHYRVRPFHWSDTD